MLHHLYLYLKNLCHFHSNYLSWILCKQAKMMLHFASSYFLCIMPKDTELIFISFIFHHKYQFDFLIFPHYFIQVGQHIFYQHFKEQKQLKLYFIHPHNLYFQQESPCYKDAFFMLNFSYSQYFHFGLSVDLIIEKCQHFQL